MNSDVVRIFLREILCNTLLKNLTDMALPCEVNYWLGYALSLVKENEESLRKVFMEDEEEEEKEEEEVVDAKGNGTAKND